MVGIITTSNLHELGPPHRGLIIMGPIIQPKGAEIREVKYMLRSHR